MRCYLLLLVLCLSIPSLAQEEGWPIVENCLGELPYPTIPQANWDFEGVIFNYDGAVGVRAIRTDIETSYIIAYQDDENFVAAGSFSPDGQWFAFPTGNVDRYVTMIGDAHYFFTGLAVVSADPRQLRTDYELPEDVKSIDRFVSYGHYADFVDIRWLDNDTLVYSSLDARADAQLNIGTGELTIIPKESQTENNAVNEVQIIGSLNDYSYIGFIQTENYTERMLAIFNTNGELVEEISHGLIGNAVLSPNGQAIIFLRENTLNLANLSSQTIEDLCLQPPYNIYANTFHYPFLWSPDSNYLAILYDGYPVLLNLETREMQILRYETWSLMGWYSLEERYD